MKPDSYELACIVCGISAVGLAVIMVQTSHWIIASLNVVSIAIQVRDFRRWRKRRRAEQ